MSYPSQPFAPDNAPPASQHATAQPGQEAYAQSYGQYTAAPIQYDQATQGGYNAQAYGHAQYQQALAHPGGQGGKGGGHADWTCSGCGNNNYAFRTQCNRCGSDKSGAGGTQIAQGGKGGGDWSCACGNSNYGYRTECRSCRAPKPVDGEVQESAPSGRDGDWSCGTCGNHNYAFRSECNRCNAPQTAGAGGVAPAAGGTRPANGAAKAHPGEWNCACGNLNYSFRTECHRCNAPKPNPAATAYAAYAAAAGYPPVPPGWPMPPQFAGFPPVYGAQQPWGSQQSPMYHKQQSPSWPQPASGKGRGCSDWNCTGCGNSNYAFRSECNRCKAPRGQPAGIARPGDWYCTKCSNSNYAFREECNRCQAPKSEAQGEARDWLCPSCSKSNYATRTSCHKCHTAKPSEEATVPAMAENDGAAAQPSVAQAAGEDAASNATAIAALNESLALKQKLQQLQDQLTDLSKYKDENDKLTAENQVLLQKVQDPTQPQVNPQAISGGNAVGNDDAAGNVEPIGSQEAGGDDEMSKKRDREAVPQEEEDATRPRTRNANKAAKTDASD